MTRWHDLLDQHLKARPHDIALTDSTGTCWSSAELDAASNAIAARLLDAGVRIDDRVVVLSGNCGPAVAAMAACSRLAAVAVPIDARVSPAELQAILDDCRPAIILYCTKASAEARAHAKGTQTTLLGGDWGRMLMSRLFVTHPAENTGLGVIFYRHANVPPPTASAAGLMFSHESLIYAAEAFAAFVSLRPGDQVAGTLPVSISSGFTAGILAALVSGARVMLETNFSVEDLRTALACGATHLLAAHPMLEKLTGADLEEEISVSAPTLRYIATSSQISADNRARAERALGVMVQTGYVPGQASGGVTITKREACDDDFQAGYLYERTELRIDPQAGAEIGAGQVGSILVRGPQVMMGYYSAPDLTRQFLDTQGWLKTGDVGWLDGQGLLHITGRE